MAKKIQSALISVFYKDGLEPIVRLLDKLGVQIISTGGTKSFIEGLGIALYRRRRTNQLSVHPGWPGKNPSPFHFWGNTWEEGKKKKTCWK